MACIGGALHLLLGEGEGDHLHQDGEREDGVAVGVRNVEAHETAVDPLDAWRGRGWGGVARVTEAGKDWDRTRAGGLGFGHRARAPLGKRWISEASSCDSATRSGVSRRGPRTLRMLSRRSVMGPSQPPFCRPLSSSGAAAAASATWKRLRDGVVAVTIVDVGDARPWAGRCGELGAGDAGRPDGAGAAHGRTARRARSPRGGAEEQTAGGARGRDVAPRARRRGSAHWSGRCRRGWRRRPPSDARVTPRVSLRA